MAPVALHELMQRALIRDRKAKFNAAMMCASLFNVNNDWKKRPQGWTPLDFMPEVPQRDEMKEFVLAIERGESVAPTKEEVACFMAQLQNQFRMQINVQRQPA